jgi:hypothetical protein
MENLKILSLGRNCIKKIENLDGVADTLEELWMSYNLVEKLVGIEKLSSLRVLYLGNNKVRDWPEVDRLSSLDKLEDLLLRGCPLYEDNSSNLATYRIEVGIGASPCAMWMLVSVPIKHACRFELDLGWESYNLLPSTLHLAPKIVLLQVLRRVPSLKKLDGIPIDVDERDAVSAGG